MQLFKKKNLETLETAVERLRNLEHEELQDLEALEKIENMLKTIRQKISEEGLKVPARAQVKINKAVTAIEEDVVKAQEHTCDLYQMVIKASKGKKV